MKNLMKAVSSASVLFLIVSILLPVPLVSVFAKNMDVVSKEIVTDVPTIPVIQDTTIVPAVVDTTEVVDVVKNEIVVPADDVVPADSNALIPAVISGTFARANDVTPKIQTPIDLLGAANFTVLSKTGVTNTGSHISVITGNVGSSPITSAAMNSIFCSEITGRIYGVDTAYVGSGSQSCFFGNFIPSNKILVDNAVLDMETAYANAAGRTNPTATELGAGNIGGMTFTPGLYKWSTGVNIPTSITLSGGPNDVWIFQITGDLKIDSKGSVPTGVKVLLSGGAVASNVFWQVGGNTGATLGTYSTFNGTILSAKQIILQTGAVLNGRALAQTQVTLDGSSVSASSSGSLPKACDRVDMNNDGLLNSGDFEAFRNAFDNRDMRSDFDQNNSKNVLDFASFLNAYAACPHAGASVPGSITITPLTGITTENGGVFQFSIVLNGTSTTPVTINFSSSDTSEGVVFPKTVTLIGNNIVTIKVTGVDDSAIDGNIPYSIIGTSASLSSSSTSDVSNFSGIIPVITFVNMDNETAVDPGGNSSGGGGGGSSGGGSGGQIIVPNGAGGGQVLGASTFNPNSCGFLNGYIKRGQNNDMYEVIKLQAFLNTFEGYNLNINGNFDDATFDAVSAFQRKNGGEVLVPWGYQGDNSTGYVYLTTQKKINEIFCKKPFPMTNEQRDEIIGFRNMMNRLGVGK